MKRSRHKRVRESLGSRASTDSFALTAALVNAAEPPETWDYGFFSKCRTFDEVKKLAETLGLDAVNEFGRIQLSRRGQSVGSFWLFD